MIVEELISHPEVLAEAEPLIHIAEMEREKMLKPHQKFMTVDGISVALSLTGEQKLFDGAYLKIAENEFVRIKGAREKVFVIKPRGQLAFGKVCYNIGNMHQKAYLTENEITVPYDSVFESILLKLGEPYEIREEAIKGEIANETVKEHSAHGHHNE